MTMTMVATTSRSETTTKKGTDDDRQWDLVVYGATGDAGAAIAFCVADNFNKGGGTNKKWAIAGRSERKLHRLRSQIIDGAGRRRDKEEPSSSSSAGRNGMDIGVVVASSSDVESMDRMAKSARVVVSAVGPYCELGESTVKACVENGTHYVDITGEVDFVLAMRRKYASKALETGATLCSFAGYDCVPSLVCVLAALKALDKNSKNNGTPTKLSKAEMVVKLEGGKAPRGTIRTVISKLPNPIGFMRDLIMYVPAEERTNTAASLFVWLLPRWSSSYGAFTAPHFMGWCNIPVVHNDFVGKVGRFHDRMVLPMSVDTWWTGYGFVQTFAVYSALAFCGPAIVAVQALAWLVPSVAGLVLRAFDSLGYRGNNPEQQQQTAAGGEATTATVDCRLHATASWAGKEEEATVRFFCEGDAGIVCTASLASETAFAMLECDRRGTLPKGTFGSPATLMGDVLVERLREGTVPGCTLEVVLGDRKQLRKED